MTRAIIDEFVSQKRLALVGVSRDGKRGYGNAARKELAAKGYELFLVHPEVDSIDGQPCARSLQEVASKVDGVVLVTAPSKTTQLVREAATAGIKRVWVQNGAESAEAEAFCRENNLSAVFRQCILMFAQPKGVHRFHHWVAGLFGKLPK